MNDYFFFFSLSFPSHFWSTLMVLVDRQNEPNTTDTECHQINIIISLTKFTLIRLWRDLPFHTQKVGMYAFRRMIWCYALKLKIHLHFDAALL